MDLYWISYSISSDCLPTANVTTTRKATCRNDDKFIHGSVWPNYCFMKCNLDCSIEWYKRSISMQENCRKVTSTYCVCDCVRILTQTYMRHHNRKYGCCHSFRIRWKCTQTIWPMGEIISFQLPIPLYQTI